VIVDEERLLDFVTYGIEVKTTIVGMVVFILAGSGIERDEISEVRRSKPDPNWANICTGKPPSSTEVL